MFEPHHDRLTYLDEGNKGLGYELTFGKQRKKSSVVDFMTGRGKNKKRIKYETLSKVHSESLNNRGVDIWNEIFNPIGILVSFSISNTTTKLWESNYSEYQKYLFNRICVYKEGFLTPIGYRKISKIFNEEGLKTPRGSIFKNNHVHSIYKKGKIREERINREDIVEVSQPTIELIK